MLAKRPWDNIEPILIVISFEWLLARWWMGGLTFHSAEHRRESLIWQLSVCPLGFIVSSSLYLVSYSGLLLLSSSLPLFFFFSPSSQHFICTVLLLRRLNWDSSFFFHLRALTYVLWHALSQFYVAIDFSPPPLLITLLLKSTQTVFAFLLSDSSHFGLTAAISGWTANQRRKSCLCVKSVAAMMKRYDQKVAG